MKRPIREWEKEAMRDVADRIENIANGFIVFLKFWAYLVVLYVVVHFVVKFW